MHFSLHCRGCICMHALTLFFLVTSPFPLPSLTSSLQVGTSRGIPWTRMIMRSQPPEVREDPSSLAEGLYVWRLSGEAEKERDARESQRHKRARAAGTGYLRAKDGPSLIWKDDRVRSNVVVRGGVVGGGSSKKAGSPT
ncbi:hypothetical protein IE53DRAFT_14326 [Violaceomyces palustris]|uniref:Uncharacterized protein n=1 Tax=Violaceomyces palustris TaxID=1673888 RepID=A0ACD0P806_9BASI|nr:hypothetical protein IE53DRAFT_14326 [Violaceomyces palustris]